MLRHAWVRPAPAAGTDPRGESHLFPNRACGWILVALALALTGCAGAMLQGALANGYDRCESQPDPVRRIRCYEDTVSRYSTAAPQTAVAFLQDARWIRAQLATDEIDDATALDLLRELRRVATIVAREEIRSTAHLVSPMR